MACTLLQTPSIGAASWENFITQVEYQRRGFMAVTYTNFSGSAVSAIATGGIIEIAGSTYQFTQTTINYTGGGSTYSDLYIYVKPDAVVSTASVVAWGSAPVWVDAKQGFYASAASITRCIGGMYVGAVEIYHSKYLYNDENLNYCLQNNKTRPLLEKTVEIGEWNMDATETKNVSLGLSWAGKIRNLHATIKSDAGGIYPLEFGTGSGEVIGGRIDGSGDIRRSLGGYFDSVDFDGTASTVANRGWVYIKFEA